MMKLMWECISSLIVGSWGECPSRSQLSLRLQRQHKSSSDAVCERVRTFITHPCSLSLSLSLWAAHVLNAQSCLNEAVRNVNVNTIAIPNTITLTYRWSQQLRVWQRRGRHSPLLLHMYNICPHLEKLTFLFHHFFPWRSQYVLLLCGCDVLWTYFCVHVNSVGRW